MPPEPAAKVPEVVQALLRAIQATQTAIVTLAVTQERLESARQDDSCSPEAVSKAAQAYRRAEATVKQAVEVEVRAQRALLNTPLTGSEPFIKIDIAFPTDLGGADANPA